jgi:hypothetical protein
MSRRQFHNRVLGPALLLGAVLLLPARVSFAADPSIAHVDGYLSAGRGCLVLQEHDGGRYSLVGGIQGLRNSDHVRLEGRFVSDPACGLPGFNVSDVQALWADDSHRSVYFDHLSGEPFLRYAERTGRIDRRGGSDRNGSRSDYDRERYSRSEERPDRNGRYVYEGSHRPVTLVGTLHETTYGCPTLNTGYRVFALDGDLRNYQAGDTVKVSGVLYDSDSGPCRAPTVVLSGIRGHSYR